MAQLPRVTVRELAAALLALPEDQQDRPAITWDDEMQDFRHVTGVRTLEEGVMVGQGEFVEFERPKFMDIVHPDERVG